MSINDFNKNAEKFLKLRSDATYNSLNYSLSFIDSEKNNLNFSPDTTENCQFYINIYHLLDTIDVKSDIIWTYISILQNTLKDVYTRQAIVNQFRFMAPLSRILLKLESPDKIERILVLLQDLSYGIQIKLEEPYLDSLLECLIKFIYNNNDENLENLENMETNDDNNIKKLKLGNLSLSILINLCYKNPIVIFLLLRLTQLNKFIKKIRIYGILGSKILIILDQYAKKLDIKNLHYFIKQSFTEINNCIKNLNIPYLIHICDFLIDNDNLIDMRTAIKEYHELKEDIEKIIQCLKKHQYYSNNFDNSEYMLKKNREICVSLIFEFLNHILEIAPSMLKLPRQIFDLAVQWLNSQHVSPKALEIMETIIEKDEENKFDQLNGILPHLVQRSENKTEVTNEELTALFKLLLLLLNKQNTKNLVISIIKESYFDKQFSLLFKIKSEMLNFNKFTIQDLKKYLYCFMILIKFSTFSSEVWLKKIHEYLKTEQMQFILAKSLLCSIETCNLVFEISKIDNFPKNAVSKKISQLYPLLKTEDTNINNHYFHNNYNSEQLIEQQQHNNIVFSIKNLSDYGRINISDETENRLNDLISRILDAQKNCELNNVATSELIELFNYKFNLHNDTEKNLSKRLEQASNEITNLSHRISLLSKDMSSYYNMNFKLNLMQERLSSENTSLTKERDQLKNSVNEVIKDFKTEQSKAEIYRKNLEAKCIESEDLKQKLSEIKEREEEYQSKIEKMEQDILHKSESLKQTIKIYEENKKLLSEKEKDNIKLTKTINDLREINLKSDNLIKHIQAKLIEKDEKIKQFEDELRETDELRNTILTLMKPKRKNNQSN